MFSDLANIMFCCTEAWPRHRTTNWSTIRRPWKYKNCWWSVSPNVMTPVTFENVAWSIGSFVTNFTSIYLVKFVFDPCCWCPIRKYLLDLQSACWAVLRLHYSGVEEDQHVAEKWWATGNSGKYVAVPERYSHNAAKEGHMPQAGLYLVSKGQMLRVV